MFEEERDYGADADSDPDDGFVPEFEESDSELEAYDPDHIPTLEFEEDENLGRTDSKPSVSFLPSPGGSGGNSSRASLAIAISKTVYPGTEPRNILIIQCGGTIDARLARATVSAHAKLGKIYYGEAAAEHILEESFAGRDVEVATCRRKESKTLVSEELEALLNMCQDASHARIIITLGLSMIIDTATRIQESGRVGHKIIVLTGSRMSYWSFSDKLRSDATLQLGSALGYTRMLRDPGVYVAVDGTLFSSDNISLNTVSHTFMTRQKDNDERR